MTVHILCAMRNAAPFIDECIASVRGQTHTDWVLWLRDDGSTDDSAAIVARHAAEDARIAIVQRSTTASGVAGAYLALLRDVPDDVTVACIDADDVWLPDHLADSLAHLPADATAPALVHGDLEVVDAGLRLVAPSLWRMACISPEPVSVRHLAVNNVVTTSTVVMNAALARIIRSRPATGAAFADSWFALAAATTGRIIARREITVRYRQHGANVVGARTRAARNALNLIPLAAKALQNREAFRRDLARTTAQAEGFARAYADLVAATDRDFLERYGALPHRPWPTRAWGVLTMRAYPGRTVLSALGEAVRC